MKKLTPEKIALITWKDKEKSLSAVGFVIKENKNQIHIASTLGMQDYADVHYISKNDIISIQTTH